MKPIPDLICGTFRRLGAFPREGGWLFLLSALFCLAAPMGAQVDPGARWRTFETAHFRVTYTPELDAIARRAAASAETAYERMSATFRPPRGKVDLVVADNYDISNGYATAFPTNRIVIYANPPIASNALRFTDDHVELVVTHELLHIFQLDRASGIWGLAQKVFGRSPYLFPNAYQPSWALEGLAVRLESQLTGSGRLHGSEHHMIARTAAMSRAVPRLDQLSLAAPRFPYAYGTYAYGSLFMDWLGETRGDSALRRYVEASSRNLLPLLIDFPARRAFGRSLTSLYGEWTRSLLDSAPPDRPPVEGWRDLTVDGAYASFPRWTDDSTLLYVGTPGRQSYGLYRLQLLGDSVRRTRLARRHTESPQSLLPDGSLVYSQLEYSDPYTLRSDLYMDRPRGGTVRLTRNARLSMPDARADGTMIAVQTVPGGSRLALVSRDGRRITPITNGDLDEHWAEPRWSPQGTSIAAIRWTRGGVSRVVMLDSAGQQFATLHAARAVVATPAWSRDGRAVYFSSDETGVSNLYRATLPEGNGAVTVARLSDANTGLFEPEPSPGDSVLAAVVFRADGYHIGVAPLRAEGPGSGVSSPESPTPSPGSPAPSLQSPASRPYNALRSLLPRYWVPFAGKALTPDSWRLGAYSSGEDLVGRHAWQALLFVPTDQSGLTGSVLYRNARFRQPLIELGVSQDWQNFRRVFNDDNERVGTVRRRTRDGFASFTAQRVRARTFAFASIGGGVEQRIYATDPDWLLQGIPAAFRGLYHYPRITMSAGWSNTQFPPMAISPEDGISLATTARYRWRTSDSLLGTHSLIGVASGFKSINLPGFSHHVAALRVAAGETDDRATSYLEVGGVSGGSIDVLPGYSLGEGRRTFQVRGFPAGSMLGMRALAANLEYRAPLLLPGRGLGTLPLFLDRTSITVFGDAGSAWCPGLYPTRNFPDTAVCTVPDHAYGRTVAPGQKPLIYLDPQVIASAGAELNINAAILSWDAPFRYRLGVAVPVAGTHLAAGVKPASFYFTVGSSF